MLPDSVLSWTNFLFCSVFSFCKLPLQHYVDLCSVSVLAQFPYLSIWIFCSPFCSSHIPNFIRANRCLFCRVCILVHTCKKPVVKLCICPHLWEGQPRVACISAVLNMKQGSYYLCPSDPSYSPAEVICKQCLLITESQLSSLSLRFLYCHPVTPSI